MTQIESPAPKREAEPTARAEDSAQAESSARAVSADEILVIRNADRAFREVGGDGAAGLSLARLYQHPMRAFTFQLARIEPGGISRRHAHPWEQVNLVISGTGTVDAAGRMVEIAPGDCIIFAPDISHAITSTGTEPLLLVGVLGPGAA